VVRTSLQCICSKRGREDRRDVGMWTTMYESYHLLQFALLWLDHDRLNRVSSGYSQHRCP